MARKYINTSSSNFKGLFQEGDESYYVDKTPFVKEIVDAGLLRATVSLILRPRRWGKTLNLSMLQSFFDIESADMKDAFASLAIGQDREFCERYENKFPVISITFKDVKGCNLDDMMEAMNSNLKGEYKRHARVISSLDPDEMEQYERLRYGKGTANDFRQYLGLLSSALYTYHHIKPLVLIDEYDVPLNSAHEGGFFDEFVPVLSGMFSSGLKDNGNISGAVITGCLQIAKNSIFTGLNNIKINTVSSPPRYSTAFGFTKGEVGAILSYYGLEEKGGKIRDWYDGYLIGGCDIFNPFSVMNAVSDLTGNPEAKMENYWANTSGDRLLRQMLDSTAGNPSLREKFRCLLEGKSVSGDVDKTMTYDSMLESERSIMGTLLFTGYLTEDRDGGLRIPNREVLSAFAVIVDAYDRQVSSGPGLLEALASGDPIAVEMYIQRILDEVISLWDMNSQKEDFPHGFLLGALTPYCRDGVWGLKSQKEGRGGWADITLSCPKLKRAIIIEVKNARKGEDIDALADKGLEQIEERGYAAPFTAGGYDTLKYCTCFHGKNVIVKMAEA